MIDSGRAITEASIPAGALLLCSQDTQFIAVRNKIQWFRLPGLDERSVMRTPVRGIRAAVQQGRGLVLITDSHRVVSLDLP